MGSDLIERWRPNQNQTSVPLDLDAYGRTVVMLAVIATFVAFATRSLLLLALLAFVSFASLIARQSRLRHQLTRDLAFEPTPDAIRVRFGAKTRELAHDDAQDIVIVGLSNSGDVGHVLLIARGSDLRKPSIPMERRVSAGTTGLIALLDVEHMQPAEHLFDGTSTFWFVAQPKLMRARLTAAAEGAPPHSRGPHR